MSGSKGVSAGAFLLAEGSRGPKEARVDAGLKEMRFPTSAGAMRVGMAQWRRTSQKALVWKVDSGGYGMASAEESPLGVRGRAAYFHGTT